jgi:hypothetical protein
MARNTQLSDKFAIESEEQFIARIKSIDMAKDLGDQADDKNWKQLVARAAFGGLPTSVDDTKKKLESLEIKIRSEFALVSARPGGARSKGTGYKLHPTFKSYMSTVKAAFEYDVELLDADGMPRSRKDIDDDCSKSRPVKNPEEKVLGALETYIKIRDACSSTDPLTVAADDTLTTWLASRGYVITLPTAKVS